MFPGIGNRRIFQPLPDAPRPCLPRLLPPAKSAPVARHHPQARAFNSGTGPRDNAPTGHDDEVALRGAAIIRGHELPVAEMKCCWGCHRPSREGRKETNQRRNGKTVDHRHLWPGVGGTCPYAIRPYLTTNTSRILSRDKKNLIDPKSRNRFSICRLLKTLCSVNARPAAFTDSFRCPGLGPSACISSVSFPEM